MASRFCTCLIVKEYLNLILILLNLDLDRCFENLECILGTAKESFLCSLPVDDLPDVLDIRSLSVEVLQTEVLEVWPEKFRNHTVTSNAYLEVVGMLPHINAKDGHLAANDGILVFGGDEAQTVAILDEPTPSTTLNTKKGLCYRSLEILKAAPCLVDLCHQGWCGPGAGLIGAGGGQVLPKERVVNVTTAVELDGTLQSNLSGNVRRAGCRSVGLECVVQVGDVGLVVLAVVQLHDLLGDARLQCLNKHCETLETIKAHKLL